MFGHLDDNAPVEPSDETRAAVARRAARLRRRRSLVPAVAVIAVVAAVLGVVASTGSNDRTSVIAARRGSTGQLRAHLEVDSRRVEAGGTLRGRLVVENDGDKTLRLRAPGSCSNSWRVFLVARNESLVYADACEQRAMKVKPGVNRYPFSVSATGYGIALPPGRYSLRFFWATPPELPKPKSLPITVTPAPDRPLEARLALDGRSVDAGGELHGDLVVVNATGKTVTSKAGSCTPKWAVALTKPGEDPSVAFTLECGVEPLKFGPGETRLPFTIRASYNVCSGGPATPGTPHCAPGGGMPPLPAGQYEAALAGSLGDAVPAVPDRVPVTVTPGSP